MLSRQILAPLILTVALLATNVRAADSTPVAFERLAGQFKFFGFLTVSSGADAIYLADPVAMRSYLPLLDELERQPGPPADVVGLLKHVDPKVRLLAIAWLVMHDQHQSLADIAALIDDDAATYPDPPIDQIAMRRSGVGLRDKGITVGAAARAVVYRYLDAAEMQVMDVRPDGHHDYAAAFAKYWATHGNRAACASWFAVEMDRADAHAAYDNPPFRDVRRVRREIDALPSAERSFVLMYLMASDQHGYAEYLATADEVDAMCAAVGRNGILDLMARRTKFDDPDLKPEHLAGFVVRHAKRLLTEADADAVLQFGETVIAAELRPKMAATWLRAALVKGGDSPDFEVVRALARRAEPDDLATLVNLTYAKPNDFGLSGSGESLLTEIDQGRDRAYQPFFRKMIADPRFAGVRGYSLESVCGTVNSWLRKPLDVWPIQASNGSERENRMDSDCRQAIRDSVDRWKRD